MLNNGSNLQSEPMYSTNGHIIAAIPNLLFDGNTLVADDATERWENVGTGTSTFNLNKRDMTVTAGQFAVRGGRVRLPYFSGYPVSIGLSMERFDTEAGVTKRVGYFSSNAVTPWNSNKDGVWVEDDGTTKRLIVQNNGVEQFNVPLSDWLNRERIANYDFSKFTVFYIDYLWQGGLELRLWIKLQQDWVLLHTVAQVGTNAGPFMQSPNHSPRYELRSTGGAGSFTAICGQVSTMGNVTEAGYIRNSLNVAGIACNVVGTTYALQGIKKNATYRSTCAEASRISAVKTGGGSDQGILLLLRNPTLSAPLSYAAYGKVDRAIATTQTVTALGEVIIAAPAKDGVTEVITGNYRKWMTQTISNVFDEYVLAYLALTATQTVHGVMTYKEHS